MMDGKKTYVIAGLCLIVLLAGWLEIITPEQAQGSFMALIALGLATLRHGIAKE